MIRIQDTLAGEPISFAYPERTEDLVEIRSFLLAHKGQPLGFDTESTGLNCYRRDWRLRTAQWGNATMAYVVPAGCRRFISWAMRQSVKLIGHNGPHDIRSIDTYLGYRTHVVCHGETYIPTYHEDSRSWDEGGIGHELKQLAIAHIDPGAGRWEQQLKAAFKEITIPIPNEVYKSGPRKGQPKYRKAKISEGWALIRRNHPAYISYAGADPILTYRLWHKITIQNPKLYKFDVDVQLACDELQRRAILLDVIYTEQLSHEYSKRVSELRLRVEREFACQNVNSPPMVATTLLDLGVRLWQRTDTGKWKVTAEILRKLRANVGTPLSAREFIRLVLLIKQLDKRREVYTDAMLRERDADDRVHTSLNSLAARTTRMSASNPPLQQLPTKDREEEIE